MKTPEQEARDMLERIGVEGAQQFSAGDVVELANLIADRRGVGVHAPKLEYEVLHVLPTDSAANMRDVLNRMGDQGWELVSTPHAPSTDSVMLMIFKRGRAQ